MSDDVPEKVALTSMDVAAQKREELQRLYPEVFAEGKIDFDRLKRVLGEWVEPGKERFGLNWPGKAECMKIIQQPSMATLKPVREESVNFDETENLFIEGDNLEVLKLLQKAYFGKVKMIYIDPPYNTGKEFIYPDKHMENLDTYLAYTGQTDAEGRKFSTNADTHGRYHSNWLNMMYPRLYLARNLLREDGVIFASIDDNEAANLKVLFDQIFGEENHLVTMYVQVRYPGKTLAEKNDYQKLVEQVLVYKKNSFSPIKESEEYSLDKFRWEIKTLGAGKKKVIGGRDVEIFYPGDYEISKVPAHLNGLKETWATGSVLKVNASGKYFGKNIASRKDEDGLGVLYKVYGIGEDGLGYRYFTGPKKQSATKGVFYSGVPLKRKQEMETGRSIKEKPVINFHNFSDSFGNCRHEGSIDFRNGKKPIEFLKAFIKQTISCDEDSIVLDFFAGSSSSAHATLDFNKEVGGNLKYIMVQLPEPVPADESQEDFSTIADISKERIRRAAKKIAEEQQSADHKKSGEFDMDAGEQSPKPLDSGFRVFRLDRSNFRVWQGDVEDVGDIGERLKMHVNHVSRDSTPEDILYELLLKAGFPLTTKVEKIKLADKPVFSVEGGTMLICLEKKITAELIDALADAEPLQVICLDEGFQHNDQLKTNAVQTFKTRAESQESEIVFRTV